MSPSFNIYTHSIIDRIFLGPWAISFVFAEPYIEESGGGEVGMQQDGVEGGGGGGGGGVGGYLDVNLWGNSFSLQNCKFS